MSLSFWIGLTVLGLMVWWFDTAVSDDDEIDYSSKPEFYDPKLDEKNESWAQKQRRGRTSDAVLSCPACFTTLSLDCQRYPTTFSTQSPLFALHRFGVYHMPFAFRLIMHLTSPTVGNYRPILLLPLLCFALLAKEKCIDRIS